jgi:hypothetical protein
MSFITFSGNKLAVAVLAAGALAVGGTGIAAVAASLTDGPAALVAETESPSPSPTATETESPSPSPTATETESPEPTPTETETATPTPTETEEPETSPTSTPVGPDATGAAAFGLCNAFTHGGLNPTSTAYDALAEAAGGESGIATYCETVPAPRDAADDEGDRTAADDSGEGLAEQQQVQDQRQGPAPASNGNEGHQPNNVSKQSVNRQR